ncbi:hypothetical protein [Alteromonas sp. AMM-1]|uniref:hypothetical protein n=1 Tax=Alteromonas sp. AMM-1 TaxID=3394233 RepID=UPI0039A4C291
MKNLVESLVVSLIPELISPVDVSKPDSGIWILDDGTWNDSGVWKDDSIWNDGE